MPAISCICCTYGRPLYLSQMIAAVQRQSFQDWDLHILNDHPKQLLDNATGDPRIHIYNVKPRFPDIAQKHNAAVGLATSPLSTIMDDDDIPLPHRLETMVGGVRDGIYGTQWYLEHRAGEPLKKKHNTLHWNYAFKTSILAEIGGYKFSTKVPFDMAISVALKRRLRAAGHHTARDLLTVHRIHAGTYHGSTLRREYNITNMGLLRPGLNERVDQALGQVQTGRIEIRPDPSAIDLFTDLCSTLAAKKKEACTASAESA